MAAIPVRAAIGGGADLGAAFEWIGDDDAVSGVPEGDGIEEALGLGW